MDRFPGLHGTRLRFDHCERSQTHNVLAAWFVVACCNWQRLSKTLGIMDTGTQVKGSSTHLRIYLVDSNAERHAKVVAPSTTNVTFI